MKQLHTFIATVTLCVVTVFLLSGCSASAEAPTVIKVGILNPSPSLDITVQGFKDGMAELGYVEGTNIVYLTHPPIQDEAELEKIAQGYVDQNVDMIMVASNGASEVALKATKTIPIVAGLVTSAVESGYAQSLAKPGGNYTGVDNGPVTPRRLQLLVEAFPTVKTVYIPYQAGYAPAELSIPALQPVADSLGLELLIDPMQPEEVDEALKNIPKDADAIFTLPDLSVSGTRLREWADAAIARQIPLIHISQASEGPVIAYGADLYTNGYQAARLADEIIKGAKPGDVPIEIGEFHLAVNMQTAEAAHLVVPSAVLAQADEIIR